MTAQSHRIAPLRKAASLRDQVGHELRAAIVSGELRPGAIYSAPHLGQMFGISPTPVREAMLDLAREGMVKALPNKGYQVTEVSDADLDHITAVRLLLEPTVVAQITPLIPPARLPGLRELARKICAAVDDGDLVAYIEADRVFHLALLSFADNPVLSGIVSELRARTRLLGLTPLLESGRLRESADEHDQLLDLIEAGDAAGAEQLMRHHIGHVRVEWAAGPARHATSGPVAAKHG